MRKKMGVGGIPFIQREDERKNSQVGRPKRKLLVNKILCIGPIRKGYSKSW